MPNSSFSKISDNEGIYDVKDSEARISYNELNSKVNNLKIESLADTAVSSPTDGQSLVYDAENDVWVNSTALTKEWVGTLDELTQAIEHGDIEDDTNILVTDDYEPSGGGSASSVLFIYSSVDSSITILKPDDINVIVPTLVSPGLWKCNIDEYGVYTIKIEIAGNTYTNSFEMNCIGRYSASYSSSDGTWEIEVPSMRPDGLNSKDPVTFGSFIVGTHSGDIGVGSASFGYMNSAQGKYSVAEGKNNISYGESSHAEGLNTLASGAGSHTEGMGTVANSQFQSVMGRYNDNKTTSLFEIGNGSSDSSRSNALEVDESGNVNISGEFRKNGNPVLDGWHPSNGTVSTDLTRVTFRECNDSYGYELFCENKIVNVVGVSKLGSGENVTITYTVEGDVVYSDVFRLRILR